MYASCRAITLSMGPIVEPKCSLKLTLNLQLMKVETKMAKSLIKAKRFLKLYQRSVTILLNSKKLWKKFNNGQRSIKLQMISQLKSFQSLITSLILMVTISLDQFVIKVPADLAILSLSLKS